MTISGRTAGICGWIFVVLLVAGNLLPGLPPNASASVSDIRRYFALHRTAFLCAVLLEGFSVIPFVTFVAGLEITLRKRGSATEAPLLLVFAAVTGAVSLAVAWFWAVLAYRSGEIAATDMRALFDLGNVGYNFIGVPFSALLALASLQMRLRQWGHASLAWLGFLAAAGQMLTAGAFARDGSFAPGGPVFIAAFGLFVLWVLLVSRILWKESPEAGVPAI